MPNVELFEDKNAEKGYVDSFHYDPAHEEVVITQVVPELDLEERVYVTVDQLRRLTYALKRQGIEL